MDKKDKCNKIEHSFTGFGFSLIFVTFGVYTLLERIGINSYSDFLQYELPRILVLLGIAILILGSFTEIYRHIQFGWD